MITLRISKRRQMPLAGAALAGLVYVGAWIVSLAIWLSNAHHRLEPGSRQRLRRAPERRWRELGLPRWLSATGALASLELVASGVGYLALDGALASAAFVSLPLLLIWVSGTGVALGRREAKDEAAGSPGPSTVVPAAAR